MNVLLYYKAKLPPETRHDCAVFLIASRRAAKMLEFAASSSLYEDALTRATTCHPTARRLERRRRGSVGEANPACATRIAPAGPPLYESGACRPHPANHRDPQR